MQDRILMTVNGAELLRKELHHLKKIVRPEVISQIAEARSHGDLKENAEFAAAKEKQSMIEGRINDIEAKLARAEIIDTSKFAGNTRVMFGANVILLNQDTKEESNYQIVGEDESDVKNNKISYMSPLARAIIGKKQGDKITVKLDKVYKYSIAKVEYI